MNKTALAPSFNLNGKIGIIDIFHNEALEAHFGKNKARIIAAGPITLQPMTQAFRVVLVMADTENGGKRFIVWNQVFPDFKIDDHKFTNNYFGNGDYFNEKELPQAMECFAKRLLRDATSMGSLLRE